MNAGYLYTVTAALCWGMIGIFSSIAFSQGLEPMEVAFWRAVLTWGCFGAQAVLQKETYLHRKDIPLLLAFGVFGVALFFIAYQFAIKTGGAAFAAVLLYTAPAWVIVVASFVYRERLTPVKVSAVILVMLGVLCISNAGSSSASPLKIGVVAILSGLTSGFCYSLYFTMGKYFSQKYSSANLFLYVLPVGALVIWPFVNFTEKNLTAWGALLAVSVLSTFIANYCYYQGLKYLEAGRASIVATLEPVVAALAAYIFLGEYFTLTGYFGSILIIVAVLTTIYRR